jgi:hypothetical protein
MDDVLIMSKVPEEQVHLDDMDDVLIMSKVPEEQVHLDDMDDVLIMSKVHEEHAHSSCFHRRKSSESENCVPS